jgi:hypothetical protein
MAAHDIGAVGQPSRVLVIGRAQQQRGGVDGTTGNDNDIRGVGCRCAIALHNYASHFATTRVRVQSLDKRIRQERHAGMLDGLIDAYYLRIRLGAQQARKSVAGIAADAAALVWVLLVEHDPDRHDREKSSDSC